jgi:CheY-like chemotaxis protein
VSFGIIRRHSGNIEVESRYGSGTEFRITLPVSKIVENSVDQSDCPATVLPEEVTPVTEQPLPMRLLVVDDEVFVRELLRDILDGENCDVCVAESGSEALALFKETHFDGVFTDVGMPGMSGWELAREIRQINKKIPIAVITGWGEAVGSHEQKEAGVDWVIAKPFTADRISELVQEINRSMSSTKQQVVAA